MRKSSLAVFAALCLIASGAMAQVGGNVSTAINNAGFDVSTGTFTNTEDGATVLDFAPGWRGIHTGGGIMTYAVVAEPTAPSAPNVLQITTDHSGAAFAQSYLDQDFPEGRVQGDFQPSHVYTFGAWFKNQRPEQLDLLFRGAIFDGTQTGYANEGNWVNVPSNVWTKLVAPWSPGFVANEFSFQVIPGSWASANPVYLEAYSFQCDSFEITDITAGERFINGGFENSDTFAPGWQTTLAATVARGMTGTIVQDPANVVQGSNALNLVKTNPGEAGDALFRSYAMPWVSGHTAYLAFSVKNDPTYGADSIVQFVLQNDAANLHIHNAGGETDGGYKRYEVEIENIDAPNAHVTLDMRLRDNTDNDATQEAAFIDFISLGDLTAGGVPVEMSAFEVE